MQQEMEITSNQEWPSIFPGFLLPFICENKRDRMTSDIRVMNDKKTSSPSPFFKTFPTVCVCVCTRQRKHLCEKTSGRARGGSKRWTCRHFGSVEMASTLAPSSLRADWIFKYSTYSSQGLFSLPSHLPVQRKRDPLLTCDFTQRTRQKSWGSYTFWQESKPAEHRVACGILRFGKKTLGFVLRCCFRLPFEPEGAVGRLTHCSNGLC